MIPQRVKYAIDRHVEVGQPCGHFVTAVLENNLREAFMRADENSEAAMREIVMYCYNEIPSPSWGSKEKVDEWRVMGGLEGKKREQLREKNLSIISGQGA